MPAIFLLNLTYLFTIFIVFTFNPEIRHQPFRNKNNKIKENSNRKQHISHKSTFFAIIQKTDIKLTSFYSLIKMDYLSLDF